jgi:hypothetical protein
LGARANDGRDWEYGVAKKWNITGKGGSQGWGWGECRFYEIDPPYEGYGGMGFGEGRSASGVKLGHDKEAGDGCGGSLEDGSR